MSTPGFDRNAKSRLASGAQRAQHEPGLDEKRASVPGVDHGREALELRERRQDPGADHDEDRGERELGVPADRDRSRGAERGHRRQHEDEVGQRACPGRGGEHVDGVGDRRPPVSARAGVPSERDEDAGRGERNEGDQGQPRDDECGRGEECDHHREGERARPAFRHVTERRAAQPGGEAAVDTVGCEEDERDGGRADGHADPEEHRGGDRGATPDEALAEDPAEGEREPGEEEPVGCGLGPLRGARRRRRRGEGAARAEGERDRPPGRMPVVREQHPREEEDAAQALRQRLHDGRAALGGRREHDSCSVRALQRDASAAADEVLVEPEHHAGRGGVEARARGRVRVDEVGMRVRGRREHAGDERRHGEQRDPAPASTTMAHSDAMVGAAGLPAARPPYPLGV
jgi:hypothetical protein